MKDKEKLGKVEKRKGGDERNGGQKKEKDGR